MGSVYVTEPNTSGSFILSTSHGDLNVQLWLKESPKTINALLDIIPWNKNDFKIPVRPQGKNQLVASITMDETLKAAIDIELRPFPTEVHSRLRWNRRGLIGFSPQSSKFIFSLDALPELDKQITIIGKVVGDSLFNLLRLGEVAESSQNEDKLNSPRTFTAYLKLPPQELKGIHIPEHKLTSPPASIPPIQPEKHEKKSQQKRNSSLLSFGNEAEEEGGDGFIAVQIKSSHDILTKDKRLKKEVAKSNENTKERPSIFISTTSTNENEEKTKSSTEELEEYKKNKAEQVKTQIEALKQGLCRNETKSSTTSSVAVPLTKLQELKRKYTMKTLSKPTKTKMPSSTVIEKVDKKRKEEDELNTLQALRLFKNRLTSSHSPSSSSSLDQEQNQIIKKKETFTCKLHFIKNCKSCTENFAVEKQSESDEGWLSHWLIFDKDGK